MTKAQAKPAAVDTIPIVDLGPYRRGEAGAAERLADGILRIQEDIGFYYLIGHGIPADLIAGAYEQLRLFYDLPLDQKMALKVDERTTGYVPFKSTIYVSSTVSDNTKHDLNENFRIVRERPDDHPSVMAGRRFAGPNKWPGAEVLPDFKPKLLAYYQALEALGHGLLPLYARALGQAPDYFDPLFEDPTWLTRNVRYAAVEPEDNQFGAAPHRDHGFITMLPISDVPGLEIQARDGAWIAAEPMAGALLVNGGEILNIWSNGRFIATPHRVLAPKRERYTIAFFYNPDWDVVVEPLAACIDETHPPRFPPVMFLDHLCAYVDRNYVKSGAAPMAEPRPSG